MLPSDIYYWYWYASLYRIGLPKRRHLLGCYGSLKELFEADVPWDCFPDFKPEDIAEFTASRNEEVLIRDYGKLSEQGITFLPYPDERYCELLKHIYDPPYGLFCIGNLALLNRYHVAVIGSRQCSPYGINCAESISSYLAERGIVIVSGMARGIDTLAHRGALRKSENSTIAVLAGGCDHCYPRQNIGLYTELSARGLIISEMPPGTAPLSIYFPIRNRIISGLSNSVVVVEARAKSGTRITADCALEQGRDVYAVPGRIYDPLSEGCNQLILDGAIPLLHPEEILKNVPENLLSPDKEMNFNQKALEKREILLYSCVDCEPVHIDELARRSGLPRTELSLILARLEWGGYIEQPLKNYYMKHIEFGR